MAKDKEQETLNFEDALKRLDMLVEEMEAGNLPLEKNLAHFEEGIQLVKACGEKLTEVEKRIEILTSKDGKLATEPFDKPAE